MPSDNAAFSVGQATHQGRRAYNEDLFGWFSSPSGDLFVISDGMGGHKGGQQAAQTTVTVFRRYMEQFTGPPDELLFQAVLAADEEVLRQGQDPELEGLGATVVALLLQNGRAWYVHVGDSRLYVLGSDGLRQLTKDHSYVQDLVDQGQISPEEAAHHEHSNLITQSIGGNVDHGRIRVENRDCREGESYLLCSDGLSGPVGPGELTRVLSGPRPTQSQANELVQLALDCGGDDNITLQVVAIGRRPSAEMKTIQVQPKGASSLPAVLLGAGAICAVGALLAWQPWTVTDPTPPGQPTDLSAPVDDQPPADDPATTEVQPPAKVDSDSAAPGA